jgi:AcrR family transcriptional regulator
MPGKRPNESAPRVRAVSSQPGAARRRAPAPRRGPGRPLVDRDTRSLILDAAELLFAEKGYVSTTTRDIADRAEVRQSMISYYFQSKDALFEAVFKRRGLRLSQLRIDYLEELLARTRGRPAVADVVRAYLRPQFEMKQSGPAGLAFVRLQSRLHNEPEELAFRLRREVYDESTKRYIAVLEQRLPKVDPADISWRMVFLIGTYLYMLAEVDRLEDLSDGRYRSGNVDELVERLTNFLVSGLMAPSTARTWGAASARKRAASRA